MLWAGGQLGWELRMWGYVGLGKETVWWGRLEKPHTAGQLDVGGLGCAEDGAALM